MMNNKAVIAGKQIHKVCEEMYHDTLNAEIPQSTNFNGVRIIMFYDGGMSSSRKGKLDNIQQLCKNTTLNKEELLKQISDIASIE